jgi:hypothetical protein
MPSVKEVHSRFPHIPHVEGWAHPLAFCLLEYYVNNFLKPFPTFNSIEFGVHHGEYFLAMENLTPPKGEAIAVDIFEDQYKNFSNSGNGNRQRFQSAVDRYAKNPDRVKVIQKDTLDLRVSDLGEHQFSLVSIDAGHSPVHVINDLELSAGLLASNGIVLLDDVFNADYAGVVTGAVQYFLRDNIRIVPVAHGFGKLLCCHVSYKQQLFNDLLAQQSQLRATGIKVFHVTEFARHHMISFCGHAE